VIKPLAALAGSELRDTINASQFDHATTRGFYESYFLRANHPTQPKAFWIRYTLFSPRGNPAATEGQLWAIYFDGHAASQTAVKQSLPFDRCSFSQRGLEVQIGDAVLDGNHLKGSAGSSGHVLSWDLQYQGNASPSFLLPLNFYGGSFPRAKVLTGIPLANFSGQLSIDGAAVDVSGWRGSQNHNWGPKHTDQYAWGQVAGFDAEPEAFLECSTARLKIGPLWTPWLTNVVLRLPGREIPLNALGQAIRNRGRYEYFSWSIDCTRGPQHLSVQFSSPSSRFVALGYDDPPGGRRTCLNTKIAACHVRITETGKAPIDLATESRAAFEILAVDDRHGIAISA
jgi:hypothetical protein